MGIMENYPIASTQSLLALTSEGNAPFGLTLSDSSVLAVDAIVRRVPNQRLVCRGRWQGKSVYAKLFFGSRARLHARRDMVGVAALKAGDILTPANIYAGDLHEPFCLLFDEIAGAQNAEQLWPTLNKNQQFALAKQLMHMVALHHNAGLQQTDIHLKNFLIQGDVIYTLDGDGIRKMGGTGQAMQNLAVFLSKFDVLDQTQWLDDLLQTYTQARGIAADIPYKMSVPYHAYQHRLKAASAYADKKVFRNCTDVLVTRPQGNFFAINTHFSAAEMAFTPQNLDDLTAQSQHRLKDGNSAKVVEIGVNEKRFALKRYNIKNAWHGLKRALQPSRAAVSWANAHRLQLLGITTPQPAMMLETRRFGLRGKAYFISEYLDAPDALQFFAEERDKLKRSEAVRNICTLFYKLYLLQIGHGDMKATNIKMQGTKPVLIDLDSMRQYKHIRLQAHVEDLQRWMQNWENDIPLYNAFVKTFKVVYPDILVLEKAGIFQNKEMV